MNEPNPGQVPPVSGPEPAPPPQVGAGDSDQPTPNQEAARYRVALRDAEKERDALKAQLQQHADAALSETDKAKKQAADLKATLDQVNAQLALTRLEMAVTRAAGLLNFADPGDALALLDRAALDIDAATGQPDPEKLEKALAALLKRKPYLAAPGGATPPPGPATNPPRSTAPGAAPPTKLDWNRLPSWGAVLSPPKQ